MSGILSVARSPNLSNFTSELVLYDGSPLTLDTPMPHVY